MYKKHDPHSITHYHRLYKGEPTEANLIGTLITDYYVMKYDKVQVQGTTSVNQKSNRQFRVHCSQRVIIFNESGMDIKPGTTISYDNYPALLSTFLDLEINPLKASIELLDYSPQTVNTQVQTSGSQTDDNTSSTSNSTSSTVGSSTAQTNSYGASASVGALPMADSASTNYEHSSTTTQSQSNTTGTDQSTGTSTGSSESDSMSIKDWGVYALVNPNSKSPSWILGQEYPWSAIDCRTYDEDIDPNDEGQVALILPTSMQDRLYDGTFLFPPSQLSAFGINFVMKALWLVTLNNEASDEVIVQHIINFFSASHNLNDSGDGVQVYIDSSPVILRNLSGSTDSTYSTILNLPIMALDVLGTQNKPAIIGFIPSKYTLIPSPVSGGDHEPFKIISTSNTLMMEDNTEYPSDCDDGAGFTASQTALSASFASNCITLNMTCYFKVVDSVNDYKLYMKHWKVGTGDIMLTFIINGDTDNPIVKYVDALEAEGGEMNLLTMSLRNQDYSSVEYYDYLQMGLNSIEIIIQPASGEYASGLGYELRAISIEST